MNDKEIFEIFIDFILYTYKNLSFIIPLKVISSHFGRAK